MESRGICDNIEDIAKAFKSYFSTFFTTNGPSQDIIQQCTQAIESKVTDAINLNLNKDYTREEVEVTLKQMSPLKSPDLDGFNTDFYQKYWSILRN